MGRSGGGRYIYVDVVALFGVRRWFGNPTLARPAVALALSCRAKSMHVTHRYRYRVLHVGKINSSLALA